LAQKHLTHPIDTESTFDFIGPDWNYYKYNHKVYVRESYGRETIEMYLSQIARKLFLRGKK